MPAYADVVEHPLPRLASRRPIRYTRCYFNVRSKADMSQLNLQHVQHGQT